MHNIVVRTAPNQCSNIKKPILSKKVGQRVRKRPLGMGSLVSYLAYDGEDETNKECQHGVVCRDPTK